jgi:hypothetical protein
VILRGDAGTTTEEDLGMDNVRLVYVPEPSALLLAIWAATLILAMRRAPI